MKKQEILIVRDCHTNNQFFTKSFPELGIWNNKGLWEEGWTEGGSRSQWDLT